MKFLNTKNKIQFALLITVCLLNFACAKNEVIDNVTSNQTQQNISDDKQDVPDFKVERKREWERIYFKSINEKLDNSQISSLENEQIKVNDLEIRIWVGFDESELKGIVLKKENNKWSGFYLAQNSKSKKKVLEIGNPKNSWDNFEKQLKESGFYDIPDITESKDNTYHDARGIVVEVKTSAKYRTYMQNQDSELKDNPELKSFYSTKLTNICKFIEKEFNVPLT